MSERQADYLDVPFSEAFARARAGDALADAIRRANEALDWIEARRQGPLPGDGYARIETSVAVVRALGGRGEMGEDDGHLFDAWQDEGGAWRLCCARAPGDHPGVTQRLFGDQAGRMVTYSIDLDAAREWSARWKACAKRLRERVAALTSVMVELNDNPTPVSDEGRCWFCGGGLGHGTDGHRPDCAWVRMRQYAALAGQAGGAG